MDESTPKKPVLVIPREKALLAIATSLALTIFAGFSTLRYGTELDFAVFTGIPLFFSIIFTIRLITERRFEVYLDHIKISSPTMKERDIPYTRMIITSRFWTRANLGNSQAFKVYEIGDLERRKKPIKMYDNYVIPSPNSTLYEFLADRALKVIPEVDKSEINERLVPNSSRMQRISKLTNVSFILAFLGLLLSFAVSYLYYAFVSFPLSEFPGFPISVPQNVLADLYIFVPIAFGCWIASLLLAGFAVSDFSKLNFGILTGSWIYYIPTIFFLGTACLGYYLNILFSPGTNLYPIIFLIFSVPGIPSAAAPIAMKRVGRLNYRSNAMLLISPILLICSWIILLYCLFY
jgi:hypothetical protein